VGRVQRAGAPAPAAAAAAGQGQQGLPAQRPSTPNGDQPHGKQWLDILAALVWCVTSVYLGRWASAQGMPEWIQCGPIFGTFLAGATALFLLIFS
jgi:hypothetical protein